MAYSSSNLSSYYCLPSIPKLHSSTTLFSSSSSLHPSKTFGCNGMSLEKVASNSRMHAKFEKFEGQDNLADDDVSSQAASSLAPQAQIIQEEEEDKEEDDSARPCPLPNLEDPVVVRRRRKESCRRRNRFYRQSAGEEGRKGLAGEGAYSDAELLDLVQEETKLLVRSASE